MNKKTTKKNKGLAYPILHPPSSLNKWDHGGGVATLISLENKSAFYKGGIDRISICLY